MEPEPAEMLSNILSEMMAHLGVLNFSFSAVRVGQDLFWGFFHERYKYYGC